MMKLSRRDLIKGSLAGLTVALLGGLPSTEVNAAPANEEVEAELNDDEMFPAASGAGKTNAVIAKSGFSPVVMSIGTVAEFRGDVSMGEVVAFDPRTSRVVSYRDGMTSPILGICLDAADGYATVALSHC